MQACSCCRIPESNAVDSSSCVSRSSYTADPTPKLRRFAPSGHLDKIALPVVPICRTQFSLASSGKSASHFRPSRPGQEGRFAIVTSVGPRCDGRGVPRDEWHIADGEVVWSWPPGAEVKLAMLMTSIAGDGGKRAGPRGD